MSDPSAEVDPEVAAIVADVADDFRARLGRGENPDVDEYAARFPQAAAEIRGVLAVLRRGVVLVPRSPGAGTFTTVDQAGLLARTPAPGISSFQLRAGTSAEPGGTFGGFEVLAELGRGGMGAVYRARDPNLRREIAIKVMLPEVAARAGTRERFLREARNLAVLHDDHVVPIFHVGEDGGVPFLVMPLLAGETLQSRLKREGALPFPEVVRIGRETALGLVALHAKGIIHRDIKPGNLWLEAPGGRVKILDFGLARDSEYADWVTDPGAIIGTPAYMSPEQANGDRVDFRTDLFSLGSVLYEAATGRPPFAGKTLTAVLAAVGEKEPTPARELNPAVPTALSDVLRRLHAKKPDDRPSSASELAGLLEGVGGHGATRPVRRRPATRMIAVIACLVLVVAVASYAIWRATRTPTDSKSAPETAVRITPPVDVAQSLRVRELSVVRFQAMGAESLRAGVLGTDTFDAVFGDEIEVGARLNRPAYAYLIAFRADGRDAVLFPQDDTDLPEKTDEPRYPTKRREVRYELDDGVGLWLIALVASDDPLPSYRDWRSAHSGGPWKKSAGRRNVVWLDDGKWLEELTRGRAPTRGDRSEKVVADRTPVVGMVDWLQGQFKGSAVSAVAFTVAEK